MKQPQPCAPPAPPRRRIRGCARLLIPPTPPYTHLQRGYAYTPRRRIRGCARLLIHPTPPFTHIQRGYAYTPRRRIRGCARLCLLSVLSQYEDAEDAQDSHPRPGGEGVGAPTDTRMSAAHRPSRPAPRRPTVKTPLYSLSAASPSAAACSLQTRAPRGERRPIESEYYLSKKAPFPWQILYLYKFHLALTAHQERRPFRVNETGIRGWAGNS